MASDQPRKLFVGGLSADTSEKDLKGIFCVFGHIAEVILLKNGETKRSRGFAFITFDSPADAQCAAKEMNGKLLDGKVIKVEPAGKPSSANYGRGTEPPISRNRVTQRSLSYGRGGYDGTRGHSSSEGNFGGSRYSPIFNMSSPRRPLLVKRIPFPRIASPPPKRSNRSAAVGSSFKVREQGSLSCGRETYEMMPRRNPVSFESDDYASPSANTYSTKDRDHLSFRGIKGYAGAPREYAYNSYRGYYSKEKRTSKSYSDRGGYDGSHGRNDHSSGGSYQDTAENHHTAPTTREFTRTFGGNSRYDDNRSSQQNAEEEKEMLQAAKKIPIFVIANMRFSWPFTESGEYEYFDGFSRISEPVPHISIVLPPLLTDAFVKKIPEVHMTTQII